MWEISRGNWGRRRLLFKGRRVLSFVWNVDMRVLRNLLLNRRLKAILGEKTITVIGDSHVHFFSGREYVEPVPFARNIHTSRTSLDHFKVFHLGPSLAYNTMTEQSKTQTKEKIDFLIGERYIPSGATVLCVFGEIDMRVHVFRQVLCQGRSYREVVDAILVRYCQFLKSLQEKGFQVMVWGALPTGDTRFNKREFTGSEVERNQATGYFNERLERFCLERHIGFISLYQDLASPEFRTDLSYLADGCHLSQKAWRYVLPKLREWMAQYGTRVS